MGRTVEESRARFLIGLKNALFSECTERLRGSFRLVVDGHEGLLSWGMKRPGREADLPLPSTADVKNEWSYTSNLPYASMTRTVTHLPPLYAPDQRFS